MDVNNSREGKIHVIYILGFSDVCNENHICGVSLSRFTVRRIFRRDRVELPLSDSEKDKVQYILQKQYSSSK
jgi:hypothetical protein